MAILIISNFLLDGVDFKMTKNIILDEIIGSMSEFAQIIGRGARSREKRGRGTFFSVDNELKLRDILKVRMVTSGRSMPESMHFIVLSRKGEGK